MRGLPPDRRPGARSSPAWTDRSSTRHEVDWDEVLARRESYAAEEVRAAAPQRRHVPLLRRGCDERRDDDDEGGQPGAERRQPMPKQDPAERVRNFDEVALGYSAEAARLEASRCLACKKPECVDGCPVGIDIPGFIRLIADGDLRGRHREAQGGQRPPRRLRTGLPAGGAVRAHVRARQEGRARRHRPPRALRRRLGGGAGAGGAAQDRAGQRPARRRRRLRPGRPHRRRRPRRARLRRHRLRGAARGRRGPHLRHPEFRLPKAIVAREVEYVRSLGVDVRLDYVVGKTRTIDRLLADVRRRVRRPGRRAALVPRHPRREPQRRLLRQRVPDAL